MTACPRLIRDLTFHSFDNGTDREEYVAATPDGRQFRITPLTKQVLEQLDGETTPSEVARRLSSPDVELRAEHLTQILQRYQEMGLLEPTDGSPRPPAPNPVRLKGFPFLLSLDLIPPRWADRLSELGVWLFYRWTAAIALLGIVAAHLVVYSEPRRATPITMDEYLWVVLLAISSILVHEIGHSSALKRFGGQPGTIGFGLYLLMPVFFADVSQLWRFSRPRRIVVDLGGVYLQQLFFVGLTVAYVSTGVEPLRMTCFVIDFMVLMSLNPIFRFDGYWVLVDYLSVPELQKVALRDIWGRIKAVFTRAEAPPRPRGLSGFRRIVFHGYSLLAGGFILVLIWIMTRYLDSAVTTLPTVIPQAARTTWAALQDGNVLVFLGKAVGFFFVLAFPLTALIGISLHVFRLGRLVWGWVAGWSRKLVDRRSGNAPHLDPSAPGRPDTPLPLDRPLGRPSDP
jgi:putative peptide zinc metalloprotease protein